MAFNYNIEIGVKCKLCHSITTVCFIIQYVTTWEMRKKECSITGSSLTPSHSSTHTHLSSPHFFVIGMLK